MSTDMQPFRASIRQRELDLKEVQSCVRELGAEESDALSRSMARYLTLRSVGYVEAVRDDLADLYASATGNRRLRNRIRHHLRNGRGAAPEQLLDFVKSFDVEWERRLSEKLDGNDQFLRNELGAMVAARKKIAHGDGDQVTTGRALRWSEAALELGKHLKAIFDPGD